MPRLPVAVSPPLPSRRGGRPKSFEEATVKVALFLPSELAGTLKAFAAMHGQTPSQVVARWIEGAEVRALIPHSPDLKGTSPSLASKQGSGK